MSEPAASGGMHVGIVADDLTGAADSAVQFTLAGWPTRLILDRDRGNDGEHVRGAVAVSTDARALGDDAEHVTAQAVAALRDSGARRLYLKVDSTMRGAINAQVTGALNAWVPGSIALVCPAYPSMRRIVADGVARANGELLQDGPAGRDPVTPVTTSVLTELLPGAVHLPATACSTAAELLEAATTTGARVICVDALSDEDLDTVAEAVALGGELVVPAGSAGLARAMARRWLPTSQDEAARAEAAGSDRVGPVVVLVSSLHDVAAEQVACLVDHDDLEITHLTPSTGDLVDPSAATSWRARLDGAVQQSHGGPARIVVISAPPRQPDGVGAAQIATALAEAVAYLHRRAPLRGVVAVGGDGVGALARRWSSASMTLRGAVLEGVPHGVLDGGDADAVPIVTKAGGFGEPDALLACVTHLL